MVQSINQTHNLETTTQSPVLETVMLLPYNWKTVGNQVAKLIARAWMDEEFKTRFVAEPVPFLQEAGISLPDDVDVKIVEDLDCPWKIEASADVQRATYLINLPPVPQDMADEDLRMALSDRMAKICTNCYCCA